MLGALVAFCGTLVDVDAGQPVVDSDTDIGDPVGVLPVSIANGTDALEAALLVDTAAMIPITVVGAHCALVHVNATDSNFVSGQNFGILSVALGTGAIVSAGEIVAVGIGTGTVVSFELALVVIFAFPTVTSVPDVASAGVGADIVGTVGVNVTLVAFDALINVDASFESITLVPKSTLAVVASGQFDAVRVGTTSVLVGTF